VKTKSPKPMKLTKEDAEALGRFASAEWDYLAGDAMQLVAEEGKSSMSRSGVLELVLDAGRLEGRIKGARDSENRAEEPVPEKIEQYGRLLTYLKDAEYKAICRVLRPAFPYARYE
jgi:hypothetical protein